MNYMVQRRRYTDKHWEFVGPPKRTPLEAAKAMMKRLDKHKAQAGGQKDLFRVVDSELNEVS